MFCVDVVILVRKSRLVNGTNWISRNGIRVNTFKRRCKSSGVLGKMVIVYLLE